MLTLLTGVGYEKERDIPCIDTSCAFRFHRDVDLRRHLKATHGMTEDEATAAILERDAAAGGQFWIGGLNPGEENFFDSATPSVPQTPMPPPYYIEGAALQPNGMMMDPNGKTTEGYFDQSFNQLSLMDQLRNEEAEMDTMMGLQALEPAVDAGEGLQWDMLAPVEHFNNME
jgi:hypothetical protein